MIYYILIGADKCSTFADKSASAKRRGELVKPEIGKWFRIIEWEYQENGNDCYIRGVVEKLDTWKGQAKPKIKKILKGLL